MEGSVPDGDRAQQTDPFGTSTERSRARYLFPVDGAHTTDILPLVCDLITDVDAELLVAYPATDSDGAAPKLPNSEHAAREETAKVVFEAKQTCRSDIPITQVVRSGETRGEILRDIVEIHDISTLVMEDRPASGIQGLLGIGGIDGAQFVAGCDSIVVTRIERLESIDSILVPVAAGPHSGLAIDTGLAIARQHRAALELLHLYDPDDAGATQEGEKVMETARERVADYENGRTTLNGTEDIARGIIERTHSADVTILGAPRRGLLQQFVLGTIPETVSLKGEGTVLVTHSGKSEESWLDAFL